MSKIIQVNLQYKLIAFIMWPLTFINEEKVKPKQKTKQKQNKTKQPAALTTNACTEVSANTSEHTLS